MFFYTSLVTVGVIRYKVVSLGYLGALVHVAFATPCPGFNHGKTAPGGGRGSRSPPTHSSWSCWELIAWSLSLEFFALWWEMTLILTFYNWLFELHQLQKSQPFWPSTWNGTGACIICAFLQLPKTWMIYQRLLIT